MAEQAARRDLRSELDPQKRPQPTNDSTYSIGESALRHLGHVGIPHRILDAFCVPGSRAHVGGPDTAGGSGARVRLSSAGRHDDPGSELEQSPLHLAEILDFAG